jgi:hypothetical protein
MTPCQDTSHKTFAAIVAVTFSMITGACLAGPPISPQMAIVTNFYKDFAFEAVIDEPEHGPGFLESSPAVLMKYLTPRLSALILKDRACTAKTHEICKLDWLPQWESQDPIGATVKIKETSNTSKVNVEVRYQQETKILTYTLQHLNVGWRIKDISYGDGRQTLIETLSAPD